jgi:hypothetical protein
MGGCDSKGLPIIARSCPHSGAEHMKENLLPHTAAVRLQVRTRLSFGKKG